MTKPIPEGYHSLTPYLCVSNAAEAIEFYKKAFGAEECSRMPGPGGKIMHAELQIGDSRLMLSDEFPGGDCGGKSAKTLGGTPVTLHLYVEDADKIFSQALQAGATISMPLEDTFWGDRFGKVVDPFGLEWSIATHTRDVSFQEMQAAAAQSFS